NQLYLDGLRVGGLGYLFVLYLETELINVVGKVSGIVVGDVQQHEVAHSVDIIQVSADTVSAGLADRLGIMPGEQSYRMAAQFRRGQLDRDMERPGMVGQNVETSSDSGFGHAPGMVEP